MEDIKDVSNPVFVREQEWSSFGLFGPEDSEYFLQWNSHIVEVRSALNKESKRFATLTAKSLQGPEDEEVLFVSSISYYNNVKREEEVKGEQKP